VDPRVLGRRFLTLRDRAGKVGRPGRAAAALAAVAALGVLAGACSRTTHPPYSPHENILSIAAEYQLLAAQDPYAKPNAEDLTGQDIARATLVRLANYESLHPGRFTPEVQVLKARAFERLHDYESARAAYREAAEYDTELRGDCTRRIGVLDELLRLTRIARQDAQSLEGTLGLLREQAAEFRRFAGAQEDAFYASLARVEAEQAETTRAELVAANRWLLPDGETQALDGFNTLVADHTGSKRALEHALRLARFHRELAEEEVRLHPPGTLDFDRTRFLRHVDAALDLVYRVSQADGRPERLVASHELDTLLALREMVLARAD
jgi:hypothetical protein